MIKLATTLSSAFLTSLKRQIGLRDDGEPISFCPLSESVPDFNSLGNLPVLRHFLRNHLMLSLSVITTVVNIRPRTSSGPGLEFFSNILAIYGDSPSLNIGRGHF